MSWAQATGCAASPPVEAPVARQASATEDRSGDPDAEPSSQPEPRSLSLAHRGLARGDGTPADAALKRGDDAWHAEQWQSARHHYEEAQRLAPRDPAPWVGLARVALANAPLSFGALSDYPAAEEALRALERALELDGDFLVARFERGRVLLARGDAETALPLLADCARRLPHDAEAQSAWGVALLASGDARGASERLAEAARLEPDRAERFANLGTAQLLAGDVDAAVRSYRTALRLAPGEARHHSDLGTALLLQGDAASAIEELRRAVRLEPERATFVSNLAYAHWVGGHYAEAARLARRALELDEQLSSAWINLGLAEVRLGRREAARQAFQRALELDPNDPRVVSNLEELDALETREPPSDTHE